MPDVDRVNLRLTAEEKKDLQARAKVRKETISDTVRGLLANGRGESTRVDGPWRSVPLGSLQPSAAAPQGSRRKRFDDDALAELAASIRAVGVIEPLAVRAAPIDGHWEIVAGERRWRAAGLAGLAEVPVIVGEWSDEQALQVQIVENLQRERLNELDESAWYVALTDDHGWDVPRICAEVGRSRSYVYQRLRLRVLHADCRAALENGKISATIGRILATVPPALQPDALRSVLHSSWNGPPTTRAAERVVRDTFRCPVHDAEAAGFDPGDATLKASWPGAGGTAVHSIEEGFREVSEKFAGSCLDCPWNTAHDASLGGEPGMCVQPSCHAAKRKEAGKRAARRAAADGRQVIAATEKDFEYGRPRHRRYVANGFEFERAAQAVKQAGADVEPALLVAPDGRTHDVYVRKDVQPLLERGAKAPRKRLTKAEKRIAQAAADLDRGLPTLPEFLDPVVRVLMRLFVEQVRLRIGSNIRRRIAAEWGDEMLEAAGDGQWTAGLSDSDLVRFGVVMCAALDADRVSYVPDAGNLLVAAADVVRAAHPECFPLGRK